MMARVTVSRETVFRAMQSKPVRDALRAKAEQVRQAAERLAREEEVEGDLAVEDGTRPKGRPYSRVSFSNADQEHGTYTTPKARILGRAAGL